MAKMKNGCFGLALMKRFFDLGIRELNGHLLYALDAYEYAQDEQYLERARAGYHMHISDLPGVLARLQNDVRNGHVWGEIVTGDNDGRAGVDEKLGDVTILLFAAAAPIAAVEVNQNRRDRIRGGENVELLPRRGSVGHVEKRLERASVL